MSLNSDSESVFNVATESRGGGDGGRGTGCLQGPVAFLVVGLFLVDDNLFAFQVFTILIKKEVMVIHLGWILNLIFQVLIIIPRVFAKQKLLLAWDGSADRPPTSIRNADAPVTSNDAAAP